MQIFNVIFKKPKLQTTTPVK